MEMAAYKIENERIYSQEIELFKVKSISQVKSTNLLSHFNRVRQLYGHPESGETIQNFHIIFWKNKRSQSSQQITKCRYLFFDACWQNSIQIHASNTYIMQAEQSTLMSAILTSAKTPKLICVLKQPQPLTYAQLFSQSLSKKHQNMHVANKQPSFTFQIQECYVLSQADQVILSADFQTIKTQESSTLMCPNEGTNLSYIQIFDAASKSISILRVERAKLKRRQNKRSKNTSTSNQPKVLFKLHLKSDQLVQKQRKYAGNLKQLITSQQVENLDLHFFNNQHLGCFLEFIAKNQLLSAQQSDIKQIYFIRKKTNGQNQIFAQSKHFEISSSSKEKTTFHKLSYLFIIKQLYIAKINEAKSCLKQSGLWDLLFLWKAGLKQLIQQITKNWHIYQHQLQDQMTELCFIIQYHLENLRLRKIKIYDDIFEDITKGISSLSKLLGASKLAQLFYLTAQKDQEGMSVQQQRQEVNSQVFRKHIKLFQNKETVVSQLIAQYILHRSSLNKDMPLIIKSSNQKHNFNQFMLEKLHPQELSKLRNLITIANVHLAQAQGVSYNHYAQASSTKPSQPFIDAKSYLDSIEEQRIVQTRCLGCSTFFKVNNNILDQYVNTVPFKIFPSAQLLKQYESQIKDQLCAMLNSGGGVILFDCIQQYQKIIVRGLKLNYKGKEEYQQRFISFLEVFYPTTVKSCINISFVPVLADQLQLNDTQIILKNYEGEEFLLRPNQTYRLRPYLENIYVMRVRVCPSQGQRVYFWNQNNDKQLKQINKSYIVTKIIDSAKVTVKMSKLDRLIKRKMKQFYMPEKYSNQEKALLETPSSYFNHQCRIPQAGVGAQIQLSSDHKMLSSERKMQQKGITRYTSMSLLVLGGKKKWNQIRTGLMSERIQCQIHFKFENYNFRSALNTAVLYHNKKFEQVLKKIQHNPKFNFGGTQLLIINITNFVKLQNRNQKKPYLIQDIVNLHNWLINQYPDEQLKLFRFSPNQTNNLEYYLQTESFESTLFIYYFLHNCGEKVKFKNPLGLDKLSEEEKQRKFVQVYPCGQSSHHQLQNQRGAQSFKGMTTVNYKISNNYCY